MKRILPILVLLLLAACNREGPMEPPPYRDAVRVGGWYYLLSSDRPLAPEDEALLGPAYATVQFRVECAGVWVDEDGLLQDECGLRNGEATGLEAGTVLRPLNPQPPEQRLAAVREGRLLVFHVYYPLD